MPAETATYLVLDFLDFRNSCRYQQKSANNSGLAELDAKERAFSTFVDTAQFITLTSGSGNVLSREMQYPTFLKQLVVLHLLCAVLSRTYRHFSQCQPTLRRILCSATSRIGRGNTPQKSRSFPPADCTRRKAYFLPELAL